MTRLSALFAFLFLASCAATGPAEYGAANGGDFGYRETQIEADRFRVVYQGSGGMPPEVVEDFALRRAAELAIAGGYDWFRVVGSNISGEERGGVSLGAGLGTGSYGRNTGVSVGVGGDLGRVGAQDYFTAQIEVLMGSGEKPDHPNIYDARSILNTVGEI
ncbi:MAG: hypothetical protein AAGC77_09470 [Pseudomonadota bacterium]